MKGEAYRVAVIGSGVVGEATGRGFIEKGAEVIFCDIDAEKIAALRAQGFTAVFPEALREQEFAISFLTVSTPTRNGAVVLDALRSAAEEIGARLRTARRYHLVVVRSTVPPGTTEMLGAVIAKRSGKRLGVDFGLCMNPEFLREKTAAEDFLHPWIIVIGEYDERSGSVLDAFYRRSFTCPIFHTTIREAELEKYMHNLYNATKISFFNEFRMLCDQLDIDADRVFPLVAKSAEGMRNPAYGTRNLGAFDGMCLPKDTRAFLTWASAQGADLPVLQATIDVNEIMKEQTVVEDLADAPQAVERPATAD